MQTPGIFAIGRWNATALLGMLVAFFGSFHSLAAQEEEAPPAAHSSSPTHDAIRPYSTIKAIPPKSFLKAKRFEFSGYLGRETINPFIRHRVGGVGLTYHVTEIFALEANLGFSPSFSNIAEKFDMTSVDQLDLTDLTVYLGEEASVQPSVTKMDLYGHSGLVFSPLYGKFAFGGRNIVNFDIYLTSGLGFVHTHDLDKDPTGEAVVYPATTNEWHSATSIGFGFRGAFNQWVAIRIEGREYFFVESFTVTGGETLNLIYFFMAQGGVSFFFPTSFR